MFRRACGKYGDRNSIDSLCGRPCKTIPGKSLNANDCITTLSQKNVYMEHLVIITSKHLFDAQINRRKFFAAANPIR
jgi:hypothetical protein